tara:strand:+ start:74 stop:247 length:174 start_codon:yes stop_codon:yes gene_type:complete
MIGKVVILKGQEDVCPKMTVVRSSNQSPNCYVCAWFDKSSLEFNEVVFHKDAINEVS